MKSMDRNGSPALIAVLSGALFFLWGCYVSLPGAVYYGDFYAVQQRVDKGADIDQRDRNDYTGLLLAAYRRRLRGIIGIAPTWMGERILGASERIDDRRMALWMSDN